MCLKQETGRMLRYLLISQAVYLVMALLGTSIADWLTGMGIYTGKLPWTFRSLCTSLTTVLLLVLHRRFTFRVNVPLAPVLIALFIGAELWNYVTYTIVYELIHVITIELDVLYVVSAAVWLVVSYLLQRYVFYRQALQTNEQECQ